MVKEGTLPFIDPRYKERSPAEAAMVTVLERAYVYDPKERISIFEVAKLLRDTLDKERPPTEGRSKRPMVTRPKTWE